LRFLEVKKMECQRTLWELVNESELVFDKRISKNCTVKRTKSLQISRIRLLSKAG
jgi:hypothetical protein